MTKKILNVSQYVFDKSSMEKCEGISETIPNEATSLHELVRRAQINAQLPAIAQAVESGEDEDFEDAIDQGADLVDLYENSQYLRKVSETIKQFKDEEAAKKADKDAIADVEGKSIENPEGV